MTSGSTTAKASRTAGDHTLMVAVTTEITPALAEEGLARELAHRIQNLRRDAGFDIADRIVTCYQGSDETAAVFEAQGAYIAAETLSERIERAAPPAGAHAETQTVEGRGSDARGGEGVGRAAVAVGD